MTAVSFQINNGVDGFKNSDVTVGTNAPGGSADFEFRYNQTDANAHNINAKEILIALKAIIRFVETGGANVDFTTGIIGPP